MANVRSCSVPTQSIIISYLWPTCGWVLLHLGLRWFSLYSPNKGMTSFSCINLKISRQNIKYFYSTKNILSHGGFQLLVRRNQKTSHSLFIAVHKVWRGDHPSSQYICLKLLHLLNHNNLFSGFEPEIFSNIIN